MVATVSRSSTDLVTDAQAIAASRDDPNAFAVLYDRYAGQLYRYAYRRLGPGFAEDAVADTFAAAFARRTCFDAVRGPVRPWLFGILARELAGHHRREEARLKAMARMSGEAPTDEVADRVSADVTAQAMRGPLAAALAALPERDRSVLLLVAWGDLSYDEVAEALRIPIGTVRSRLNRARRKVRTALGGVDPIDIEGNDND